MFFLKKKFCISICFIACALKVFAQINLQTTANHAWLITQMANKFHVQPKPVNEAFGTQVFTTVITSLDKEKIIFTQQQIQELLPFSLQLHNSILQQKTNFLQVLIPLYKQQLQITDSLISLASNKPINYTIAEVYTVQEDTSFAANIYLQQQKINKLIKHNILQYIAEYWPAKSTQAEQKKFTDSIEPIARKKVIALIKRSFTTVLQQPQAAENEVAETYCNSIALTYDPHSSYFTTNTKERFESGLGKKPLRFGFSLDETEDGTVEIESLKPGSAAYKSGMINNGDKITAIQWEGQQSITVADKGAAFVSNALDGNTNQKLTVTVQKADGTSKQVVLQKEEIDNGEDESKVKSFVLKGSKAIGYISLPAFYEDWDSKEVNVNGCANDVGKEILKLKKEGIEGLIIDVRYNGGGSMQEAIELAGIFIDAGPVGQIKSKEPKPITLKDINRGTLYDGPLVVMVNGYSASASEMLAGTLQDYNRAVIVGSPTFGKATAQVVLPLDTTINLQESNATKKADGYIKITVSSLYRITGQTAQITGVQPHIILPDVLSAYAETEAEEPFALVVNPIEANKYYKAYATINTQALQIIADTVIANWPIFKFIKERIAVAAKNKIQKNISLKLSDVVANNAANTIDEDDAMEEIQNKAANLYSIANTTLENKRLDVATANNLMNEQWKIYLTKDPYIKTAFLIAQQMAIK